MLANTMSQPTLNGLQLGTAASTDRVQDSVRSQRGCADPWPTDPSTLGFLGPRCPGLDFLLFHLYSVNDVKDLSLPTLCC